jgi:adenine-specific DNA-methyltransferase
MEDEEKAPKTMLYPRDPSLDPQLVWKGKDEQDQEDLEVPTVPIYIQEKIQPQVIIENVRAEGAKHKGAAADAIAAYQMNMFADFNHIDFEDLVEFYQHEQSWTNRMVLGDSLLVMNSLAEKEGLKGRVQMIYMDPPYGIKFGSNWQSRLRKKEVKDGAEVDLTREPEQVKAFRDTWELGIHSYLSYLRDRFAVARELLTESGSIFVQIGDENVHLVRCVLDEVFGSENQIANIAYRVFGIRAGLFLDSITDNILWYSKDKGKAKYHQMYLPTDLSQFGVKDYDPVRLYRPGFSQGLDFEYSFQKQKYKNPSNMHWVTGVIGLDRLSKADRLQGFKADTRYKRYVVDFPASVLTTSWQDT